MRHLIFVGHAHEGHKIASALQCDYLSLGLDPADRKIIIDRFIDNDHGAMVVSLGMIEGWRVDVPAIVTFGESFPIQPQYRVQALGRVPNRVGNRESIV